jgi:two-component system sensor histidine kinase KdpD
MKKMLAEGTDRSAFGHYLIAVATVIAVSAACYLAKDLIGYRVVSLTLLLVVSLLAVFLGTIPVLVASTLSAMIWDFFFIPPHFTFHIGSTEDILMLAMFFIVTLLNGILTSRIKRQELRARQREERTDALYQLTKELLVANGVEETVSVAEKYLGQYFKIGSVAIVTGEERELLICPADFSGFIQKSKNLQIARWVLQNQVKAGRHTDNFSDSDLTFYPVVGGEKVIGVICFFNPVRTAQAEEQFLEACIALISGKVERELLSLVAKDAFILAESDKLYKTLFNSISHELRIPVAAIIGATDTLLSERYPETTRKKLYREMSKASVRLNRLIDNLLNMSRLESGHLTPHPDWCDVHDLVNKVTGSLEQELGLFSFVSVIPDDMPLVCLDFGLTEHVIHNLVLNASQYAPEGTEITVSFRYDKPGKLVISVADQGRGFTEKELNNIFHKFYRGETAVSGGTGLGLSIVRGFVEAQGGSVYAANGERGGAVITVELPVNASEIISE